MRKLELCSGRGGGQSRSLHTGWNWTEIFFLFFFLTNTGKLASPIDYSTLVPIPLNIRTPLSLVEKRTHWATCPLNRSPHSVVRSEGGKCGTIYFLFAGTWAYQVNERSPGPRVPHALPSGTTSTYWSPWFLFLSRWLAEAQRVSQAV